MWCIYIYRVFLDDHMVKCRKIKKMDVVKYGGHEWYVKKKKDHKCQLVRCKVMTGVPIWVPLKRVKHACISWRSQLKKNDPLEVFVGGIWCPANVIRREGNYICAQLCFTNFTVRLPDRSSRIAEATHDYPLWSENTHRYVLYESNLRIERAPGILFPMEYATGAPVQKPKPQYVTTLKFKLQHMPSFSMKLYNQLSTEEIMHDIHFSMCSDMPLLLRQIATQYVIFKRKAYPLSNTLLQSYVEEALSHNDHQRVQELMTVSNNEDVMQRNEWAIRESLSFSYFDVIVRVTTCLEIDLLYNTMFTEPVPAPAQQIMFNISHPLEYNAPVYMIDSGPCLQYILSRMLGMEETDLQRLHLREVNGFYLTETTGFCKLAAKSFGGVINVYGLDVVALVTNLIKRSPLKTLVIVDPNAMESWSDFSQWHGRKKEDDTVVVTTKSTLRRNWSELKGFKRIISLVMPKPNTVFENVLKNHSAKIKWAICKNSNEHLGWRMIGQAPDSRALIHLTKSSLEHMGVLFPVMSIQKIVCDCNHESYKQIFENTYWMQNKKVDEYLSKFLLHPDLVPAYIRGKKLDVCEGTLTAIAKKFRLDEDILQSRISETCSVCLETISDPSVTSCGHVFCETCVKELEKRKINCAMCRAKISGYMKISDKNTPGIIEMHNGSCYRIPEKETWGMKYHILKQYTNATFVTKYSTVKTKLKKVFPNTQIITERALQHGMTITTSDIVLVEPGINIRYFDKAWSQDLNIIQLSYRIKHTL